MEFKKKWYEKNPGKVFNVDMSQVAFRCQIPLFDTDTYGETLVRVFDCSKQEYKTYSHAEWLKKKKCTMSGLCSCKAGCTSCKHG